MQKVQQLFESGDSYVTMEEERVLVGGETRWIFVNGICFRDATGRVVRWTGSATDITERKRAEEELRSRQEMLDLAQKAAHAIAFEWKIGEGKNRWSPELEAMYGLAPGTYDGSYAKWKELVHPEDWPAVSGAIEHAHRTGDISGEYRVVHPDGSVRWLQAKGRLLFNADGFPSRLVGFMQDVTQRKHAEEEMGKLEARLRQAQRLEAMGNMAGVSRTISTTSLAPSSGTARWRCAGRRRGRAYAAISTPLCPQASVAALWSSASSPSAAARSENACRSMSKQ
jgi:PAS domain S-box-containing protein